MTNTSPAMTMGTTAEMMVATGSRTVVIGEPTIGIRSYRRKTAWNTAVNPMEPKNRTTASEDIATVEMVVP